MAPLSPDNTPRLQLLYTSGEFVHTAQIRPSGIADKVAAEPVAAEWAGLLAELMTTADSIFEARWIPEGTNIYQLVAFTEVPGVLTPPTVNDRGDTAYMDFVGRSDDGREVRMTLFSTWFQDQIVFRKTVSDAGSQAEDIRDFLNGMSPVTTTISGEEATWKAYVNYGFNSHFQRKQR